MTNKFHLNYPIALLLFAFAAVSVLFGLKPEPVHAHTNTVGYSDITIAGNEIKYALYLDPGEVEQWLDIRIRKTFVLDQNQPQKQAAKESIPDRGDLDMFVTSNLTVKNNGSSGMLNITDTKLEKRGENEFLRIDLIAVFEKPVQNYDIQYNFFFNDIDNRHQNFANLKTEGTEMNRVLNSNSHGITGHIGEAAKNDTEDESGIGMPGWLATLWTYMAMGVEHIWSGYDHLLFLLGLVIFKQTKRYYIKMLTAFTLGHSITLVLSALEIVTVSFRIIEPLIALSIVYVAVENMRMKQSQRRWGIAAMFGLIHGFGFSDILRGSLDEHVLLSLFSFNLGVEIGQLAVLALLLPLLWLLGRVRWYPRVVYGVSGIVGCLGLFWFVERVFG